MSATATAEFWQQQARFELTEEEYGLSTFESAVARECALEQGTGGAWASDRSQKRPSAECKAIRYAGYRR